MTWLIIYTEKKAVQKENLAKFFKQNKICAKSFKLPKDAALTANIIHSKLKGITHCVILDETVPGRNSSFAWGYTLGSAICVYALKNEFTSAAKKCGCLKEFVSFEKLSAFLEKNIRSIEKEDTKRRAYKKLFDTGNPFTGDSLATHITKDNRELIQDYMDAGMSLNERTSTGTPMLNVAIRAEQESLVEWMLTKNIDLDAVSRDRGYSALMDCVWKKNLGLAKILISRGVNLNFVSNDNQSALVLAVGEGAVEIVRILAEAGADPDKSDSLGMSAYAYAKLFHNEEILKILEKYHHEK